MFLGTYAHSLDNKNRLTIPAKYRDFVAPGLVLTRDFQGKCLMAVPMGEWANMTEKVSHLSMADPKSALLRRMLFGSAEDMRPDSQGRIVISPRLREVAGIETDVMVVGVDTHFELWNPQAWEQNMQPLDDPAVMGELFATLGI